jgi:hypothetical protein
MTPDSYAAGSGTPGASRSATALSESAAVVAGSHVESPRHSENPPPDRPGKRGDTAAAVPSGSAQQPPPSAAPRSGSAGRAADTDSDSSDERQAESSLPSSATDAQSQSTAHPASSASSTPARRARPAPQSKPISTSSSAVEAGGTTLPTDKAARERRRIPLPTATSDLAPSRASGAADRDSGAADTSADRVSDHDKGAAVTADSSGQPSSAKSRSADEEPSSPARQATPDHPPTGTSAKPASNHRDDREQR